MAEPYLVQTVFCLLVFLELAQCLTVGVLDNPAMAGRRWALFAVS